jgi:hypothetical protein
MTIYWMWVPRSQLKKPPRPENTIPVPPRPQVAVVRYEVVLKVRKHRQKLKEVKSWIPEWRVLRKLANGTRWPKEEEYDYVLRMLQSYFLEGEGRVISWSIVPWDNPTTKERGESSSNRKPTRLIVDDAVKQEAADVETFVNRQQK